MTCSAGLTSRVFSLLISIIFVFLFLFSSVLPGIAIGDDPLLPAGEDAAAGAVLLFSLAAAVVGAIIFLPRLVALCRSLS